MSSIHIPQYADWQKRLQFLRAVTRQKVLASVGALLLRPPMSHQSTLFRNFSRPASFVVILRRCIGNCKLLSAAAKSPAVGKRCTKLRRWHRRGIGRAETRIYSARWRASAAPADAGKTAVRILRFDAAAASASAANCGPGKIPELFSLSELHVSRRLHGALLRSKIRA